MDAVAEVVGLLHQCQRHHYRLLCASVDVHVARTVVDAYHVIIDLVYAYHLSARVAAARKQVFINLLAYNAHLAVLLYVHIV